MAKKKDLYAQLGYIGVTESGANTLTFDGLSVFSNVLQPNGLLIHSVEYNVSVASMALIVASEDAIKFGLAGDDSQSSVALDNAQTYDWNQIRRLDLGAAASGLFDTSPVVKSFNHLPQGGKLVPADRLYGWIQGVSLASAAVVTIRFYYTLVDLTAQEYIELAQSLRVLT